MLKRLEFYKAKIKVADFYFDRLLPRAQGHAESMITSSRTLTSLAPEHFQLRLLIGTDKRALDALFFYTHFLFRLFKNIGFLGNGYS